MANIEEYSKDRNISWNETLVEFVYNNEENGTVGIGSREAVDLVREYLSITKNLLFKFDDIPKLSGYSCRTMRILTLKAITHPYLFEKYAVDKLINDKRRKVVAEFVSHSLPIVKSSTFDFMSSTIGESDRPWHEVILNPFNVIRDKDKIERSPLLGWFLFHLLQRSSIAPIAGNFEDSFTDSTRHELSIDKVIAHPLMELGYPLENISAGINTYIRCGLLKEPVTQDRSSLISYRSKYVYLDKIRFEKYADLMFGKRPSDSIQFFEHCFRDIHNLTRRRSWEFNKDRFSMLIEMIRHVLGKEAKFMLMTKGSEGARRIARNMPSPRKMFCEEIIPTLRRQLKRIKRQFLTGDVAFTGMDFRNIDDFEIIEHDLVKILEDQLIYREMWLE